MMYQYTGKIWHVALESSRPQLKNEGTIHSVFIFKKAKKLFTQLPFSLPLLVCTFSVFVFVFFSVPPQTKV